MFSFSTNWKLCNEHKTHSAWFFFLMIELSFILSVIKIEDMNTYLTPKLTHILPICVIFSASTAAPVYMF